MAKFKLKSKRSTVKRLRATGSGKVKHGKTGKRHLNTNKSRARIRGLKGTSVLRKQDAKLVLRSAPYGLPK